MLHESLKELACDIIVLSGKEAEVWAKIEVRQEDLWESVALFKQAGVCERDLNI